MGNGSVTSPIFVRNPEVLLERDEKGGFDALSYLKCVIEKVYSVPCTEELALGRMEKSIDTLTTHSRNIGYGTFTGYLCSNIARQVQDSSALSTANNALGSISTLIFGSLYGVTAIRSSYWLAKSHNFSDLLKKEDDQVLQHLMQDLCQPISSNLDQLKASWNHLTPQLQRSKKQKFKQKLQKEARTALALEPNKELLKHLQEPLEGIESLLGLKDQEYWQLNPLEAIGLVITQQKIRQRNWTELKELTNPEVARAVDKAYRRGLLERAQSDKPAASAVAKSQVKKLVGRVRAESMQTKKIHRALLIINLLGAIISLVGLLTLPLGIGVAITAISCLITASSVGLNMYLAKQALLDSPPSKHGKAFIITAAILLVLSLAVLTGVTLVFGLSLIQLGVALGVGGLLGGGFLGYHYYLLGKKDQLWKEAHPSVEAFKKLITKKKSVEKGWDKEVHNVFKKLPKSLRQKIRQKYELEGSSNPYTLTNEISAFKKTSKYFWQKWQASGSEEDRIAALEVQNVYDALILSKQYAKQLKNLSAEGNISVRKKCIERCKNNNILLENAKNRISTNKQVQEQLQKDLRYILARKSSLSRLAQDIEAASTQVLTKS